MSQAKQRDRIVLVLLSFFLWWAAADRFYMGRYKSAFLKLITLGGCGVWAMYDWILCLTNRMTDENGNVAK